MEVKTAFTAIVFSTFTIGALYELARGYHLLYNPCLFQRQFFLDASYAYLASQLAKMRPHFAHNFAVAVVLLVQSSAIAVTSVTVATSDGERTYEGMSRVRE